MIAAMPYASLLGHFAAIKPNATAITDDELSLSWAELDERTNRAARAMIARGVSQNDLVTIALPNGSAFIETCFACWKAGATPQPVSPRLPRRELDAVVDLAQPWLVIAESSLEIDRETASYADLLAEEADSSDLPLLIASAWKAPTSGGSTGRPKLILANKPAYTEPDSVAAWRLKESDVALMPGPLYHNGPFVTAICALVAGAHLVIMPRFDPETVLVRVEELGATWLYLVPTMMNRIWKLGEEIRIRHDMRSLETVWHLAAPCPPWLKHAWIDWLGPKAIWEIYAATEGMAGTVITGAEWLTHPGSVGRVFAGEIRILDDQGQEVPAGEIGEIYMKSSGSEEPTYRYIGAEPETRGEWQTLGDMGYFDTDGFLFLADRRTDMILVGGANVYPAEIEHVIEEHPLIRSCAVIGLPDEDLGARIHAIVENCDGFDESELRTFVAERLITYKQPKTYECLDVPLRDTAGKVRRGQLRLERLTPEE